MAIPNVKRPILTTRQISTSLHRMAGLLLRAAGFRLTLLGAGDLKIGVWRKELRAKRDKDEKKKIFALIPGFADSPLSWLPCFTLLQTFLARRFDELVLYDFPGYHGYLFGEPSFDSIDKMLEVLIPSLDEIDPTAILGHSLGGGLVAHYAGMRGEGYEGMSSLEQVILVAPTGVFVDREFRVRLEERILNLIENGIECLREIRPSLIGNDSKLSRVLSGLMEFASQQEIRQFILSFRDLECLDQILPQIRARVDLVWGSDDELIPPTVVPCWLAGLRNSEVRVTYLDGVGHAPQLQSFARLSSTLSHLIRAKLEANPEPFSAEISPVMR